MDVIEHKHRLNWSLELSSKGIIEEAQQRSDPRRRRRAEKTMYSQEQRKMSERERVNPSRFDLCIRQEDDRNSLAQWPSQR